MLRDLLNNFRRKFIATGLVLMYHRVATVPFDPWELAVSPENFDAQVRYLKENFNVITAEQMAVSVQSGNVDQRSVCITFDDGYRDNYTMARPVLEKYQCPASFFIPAENIEKQKNFWWDTLADCLLGNTILPERLTFMTGETVAEFDLAGETGERVNFSGVHRQWTYADACPTKRAEVFLAIWSKLKPLPLKEIEISLARLSASVTKKSGDAFLSSGLPMTMKELQKLSEAELFTVAVHTTTHPSLKNHSFETQKAEMESSYAFLRVNCRRCSAMIAYPYGDYNGETVEAAKLSGLKAGFTTEQRVVTKSIHPFAIGRFQVNNWSERRFAEKLNYWRNYC